MGVPKRPNRVDLLITQLPIEARVRDGRRAVNERLRQEASAGRVTVLDGGLGHRARR